MNKFNCPTCAARYNVPDEKLGKRVKCAKCGEHFHLTPPPPIEPQPAAAGDDLFPDLPALQSGVIVATAPIAPAESPAVAGRRGRSGERLVAARGPAQLAAYLNDVFLGFARIIAHPWELLTVVAVCFICLLKIPAGFAGRTGGSVAQLIITGWYLSFLLKVVQSGANRENGLPDFSLADGVYEDIVLPCLSFLVVRLISVVPLIGVLIYAVQENRLDGVAAFSIGFLGLLTPELALIMAFLLNSEYPNLAAIAVPPLLLGLAAVPMLVMVVAIAGIEALTRVDLMLTTIVRTLPGYVAATVIYFASLGLAVGAGYVVEQAAADQTRGGGAAVTNVAAPPAAATAQGVAPAGSDPNSAGDPNAAGAAALGAGGAGTGAGTDPNAAVAQFAGSLLAQAVTIVVGVFASVFAMRAVGLYYAHFKRGFAWSWE